MDQSIVPFDLQRMFLGDAPPLYLLEILFRTVFIYGYTLMLLRWIGARSVAQLSIVEFILVIALGSAVGDSLFYPDVPLFHAMLVISVVVGIDKLIDLATRRSARAKRWVDGDAVDVVENGRILTDGLFARAIGTAELMEMLRMQGIENLGEVRAAYLEASGHLSTFRAEPRRKGLAIVPPHEVRRPPPSVPGEPAVCAKCGADVDPDPEQPPHAAPHPGCRHCAHTERTIAS